jgi:ABC-type cobalt transport system substrate-binding protein
VASMSKKTLWISLAALVVVIAVACVLVFVVFHDQVFGGASGPEQKVQEVITTLEDQDVDALYALIDPQGITYLENTQAIAAGALKTAIGEGLMGFDSVEYKDVKMKTVMDSDGQKATVTLVGGQMTTVSSGQPTVEDLKDSADPQVFYVVLRDGTWYLDIVRMTEAGSATP